MASLLNMSGGSLLKKGLPYDAEIEYLEGTGTQYIATDIEGNRYTESLEVEVDFYYVDKSTKESHILSAKNTPTSNNGFCTFISTNGVIATWVVSGSVYYYEVLRLSKRYQMKAVFNKPLGRVFTLNGATYTSDSLNNYTDGGTIVLFMDNSYGVLQYASPAKIRVYSAKVTSNGFVIADFIPVRVGTAGYIYNKVSGRLYGNAGTGNFILGPDKH